MKEHAPEEKEKKIVLVTGSTRNTGIGIARTFLEEGCELFINGRDAKAVEKVVAAIGDHAHPAPCDLADPSAVRGMFDSMIERFGRIDVLVNRACPKTDDFSLASLWWRNRPAPPSSLE